MNKICNWGKKEYLQYDSLSGGSSGTSNSLHLNLAAGYVRIDFFIITYTVYLYLYTSTHVLHPLITKSFKKLFYLKMSPILHVFWFFDNLLEI